jgi:hypothetical protein
MELTKEHLLPYSQVDLVFAADHTQLDESFTFNQKTLGILPDFKPDPVRELVSQGVRIVPELVKELDNRTLSKIVIGHALLIVRFDATVPEPIEMSRNFPDEDRAFDSHTLTVGDLAYFVLGQIVNRRLNSVDAVRGGWTEFSGPSAVPQFAVRARAEWKGTTPIKLKASLIQDVRRPAVLWRDVGAIRRLLKWYPGAYLTGIIKERLRTPITLAENDEAAFKARNTHPVIWRPDRMTPSQHIMFVRAIADFKSASIDRLLSQQLPNLDGSRDMDFPPMDEMAISIISRIATQPNSIYIGQCIRFCEKRATASMYANTYVDVLHRLKQLRVAAGGPKRRLSFIAVSYGLVPQLSRQNTTRPMP